VSATDVLPAGLTDLLPSYLGRQRWYAGSSDADPASVQVPDAAELPVAGEGAMRLWWLLVEAEGARYQLLLGERPQGDPAEFLHGHDAAALGSVGAAYFYDATLDPELARALLAVVTGGEQHSTRVRPVTVEQSNTSLVYDDRIILKVFRRLVDGRNPDVEVTTALASAGFAQVATPSGRVAAGRP
jgi:maltokinase